MLLQRKVTLQRREDPTRVNGKGGPTARPKPPAERIGEESIGGLGLSVGRPLVVGAGLEVDVFPADPAHFVAGRGERHDACTLRLLEQIPEAQGQGHVTEMVGTERHDAGIADEKIESLEPAHRLAGAVGEPRPRPRGTNGGHSARTKPPAA